jgi:formamidopyrimidine-DNA glycosylase
MSLEQKPVFEDTLLPELPELKMIAEKLAASINGETIIQASVNNHLPIHGITVDEFKETLQGKTIQGFKADGKFLLIRLSDDFEIIINPMLTGRFTVRGVGGRPSSSDIFRLRFKTNSLWYSDRKKMGRVYLIHGQDYANVAEFTDRGPSALSPDLTLEEFNRLLQRRRGQIKNILRNQHFVKGIGNAYADEILLYAGILPFRKRSTLTPEEIERLFHSMKSVLSKFTDIVRERTLSEIALENRDFLMIHGRKGGVCPLCGGRVSEVTANRFKTNFCQTCQK